MKNCLSIKFVFLGIGLFFGPVSQAQLDSNVYFHEEVSARKTIRQELKIDNDYFIHTVYEKSPAKFVKTLGGFYKIKNDTLLVNLEFNSDFQNNPVRQLQIPFTIKNKNLLLHLEGKVIFKPASKQLQDLDNKWLFATRGPDTGQERRDGENPRKTLKFLQNGHFQWIAYNTESMKFFGTGGGTFTSMNGAYQENIEFFSRDNSRVGASLNFNYELKEADWHHTGKNSKGEPMYEIWTKRK